MDAVLDRPTPRSTTRKRKPKQITPRLLRYAELRAQGCTQSKAAVDAGYSAKQAGGKAERNPLVQRYLLDVRSAVRCATAHTVVAAMIEAKAGMDFAEKTGNANAYVKAVELRAKLSGLLIDRVEVFTMDMRGAIETAQRRVISVSPAVGASIQLTQAPAQAAEDSTV